MMMWLSCMRTAPNPLLSTRWTWHVKNGFYLLKIWFQTIFTQYVADVSNGIFLDLALALIELEITLSCSFQNLHQTSIVNCVAHHFRPKSTTTSTPSISWNFSDIVFWKISWDVESPNGRRLNIYQLNESFKVQSLVLSVSSLIWTGIQNWKDFI